MRFVVPLCDARAAPGQHRYASDVTRRAPLLLAARLQRQAAALYPLDTSTYDVAISWTWDCTVYLGVTSDPRWR